jgi:3-dehydroquinate dehydratase I
MSPAKAQIVGILDQHILPNASEDCLTNLAKCNMAEFRADLFCDLIQAQDALGELRRLLPSQKWILTVRLQRDGGKWPNDERTERIPLIKKLLATGWFYALDLEVEEAQELYFARIREFAEIHHIKLIVSHHNFTTCYANQPMQERLHQMQTLQPHGIKMALYARTSLEAQELLQQISTVELPELSGIFAMGTYGTPTRLAAPLVGAPLTYGFLAQNAQAPGQLSTKDLFDFYQSHSSIPSTPGTAWVLAQAWLDQRAPHA